MESEDSVEDLRKAAKINKDNNFIVKNEKGKA